MTNTIFEQACDKQGWSQDSQIAILLEYIENQQSDAAFENFLAEKIEWENKDTDEN